MRIVAIGLAAGLLLTGCSQSDDSAQGGNGDKLLVATTVSPMTSIAANIGGDLVDVQGIVPEGTNSHTFEPDPSVAGLLSDADLILVNGLKLEDPTLELAQANKRPETEIVEVGTDGAARSRSTSTTSPSPRRRASPTRTSGPTRSSRGSTPRSWPRKFSELDPDNAANYDANLTAFLAKTDGAGRCPRGRPGQRPRRDQARDLPRRLRVRRASATGGTWWGPSSRATSPSRPRRRSPP